MVKFIMRRDSCDFKAAAKRLGAWREWLSEAERVQITRGQQARCLQRQLEESIAADDRRERIRLRDELHTAARIYYDLESLLRELGPCEKSEQILETLPEVLDDLRLTESAYCRAAKLEDPNDL